MDIKNEIRKFLGDTLQFNISSNYIASDNNKRNQIEGLAYRDNEGKFVVKIGDKIFTFDSYNDFIINNDLVRVNTKPNESGNNFTRTSSNPNIRYKIVTSSPVEDSNTREQTKPQTSEDIQNNAINIMQSGISNKAEAIANLIFDKNTVDLLTKNDLLPTTLVYDENFNTGEGRETINASFNKSNKVTTIGPRFMSILSNNNVEYRKQAIRKLIHEKLHDKLHSDGNEHFIKDIESIYDEFCKYLDDAEFSKPILEKYLKKAKLNKSLDEYYDNFKKYKYLSKQNKDVALEEFLVDSLTSVELANYLNNITGLSKVNMKKLKRDSLLNKIMRVLAKLMGINIKNNSLYAQEFEAIRNAIDSTIEITEEIDNKNEKLDNKNEQDNVKQEQEIEPEKDEDENSNIYQDLNDDFNFDEYSSTTIEEYNKELPSELQEIKDKAIADGTFMKAPNGKQTNLNERQWLQVRTKAFKDWFGDWENDPDNASKVIDDNGEPLVVYHRSDAENISVFKPSYYGPKHSMSTRFGEGASFFTDNKNDIRWGKYQTSYFLNIRVPFETSFQIESNDNAVYRYKQQKEDKPETDGIFNIAYDEDYKYDELVVFNPNQIKSATDNTGTFNTKDDNIYNSDTIEEYETVASIGDYIQSYSPEDRAEIAREINNGNISIKCK